MQNALYFENSHVRPVSLLIGAKKKFRQGIITKYIYISCTAFTLEKNICLVGQWEKKSFQGKIFQPPPSKVKWFAPKRLEGKHQ